MIDFTAIIYGAVQRYTNIIPEHANQPYLYTSLSPYYENQHYYVILMNGWVMNNFENSHLNCVNKM